MVFPGVVAVVVVAVSGGSAPRHHLVVHIIAPIDP